MTKHLLKQLLFLLSLCAIIAGTFYYLVNTESGLRTIFYVAAKIVPGKISVKNIHGRILDQVKLSDFNYTNKTVNISLENAQIHWNSRDLLFGKFSISSLHADNFIVQIKTAVKPQMTLQDILSSLQNLKLPAHLKFTDVQITNFIFQENKQPAIKLSKIIVESRLNGENIYSLNAEIQAQRARLIVSGSIQKQWDLHWKLSLADLQQFIAHTRGTISCEGTILGARKTPAINSTLTINKLVYGENTLEKLQGTLAINTAAKKNSSFTLEVSSPTISGVGLDKFTLFGEIQPINFANSEFTFNLNSGTTTIFFDPKDKNRNVKINKSVVQGRLSPNGFSAKSLITIAQHDAINAEIQLPKLKQLSLLSNNQPLSGQVNWQTQNLTFLQSALPNIKNLQGLIKIKYILSGTLQNPKFIGNAEFSNASFVIPELNLNLHGMVLSAQHSNNKITYHGAITSGSGILNLTGETLLATNSFNSKINLNGKNFLVANTPEYKIIASAKLQLVEKNDLYDLQGQIFIPEATLKPKNSSGTNLPAEVVYVKKEQPKQNAEFPLKSRLQISLGDAVNFDVMDLKGKLEGQLQITDAPNTMATAIGNLYIKNGSYTLYGQQLQVTNGALHFLGGVVTNPEVNVQAVRDFKAVNSAFSFGSYDQELQVGIKLTGMLDNLHVDLFSVPSGLSKSDILSYLVVGQPSDQASGAKAQLLLQAASALNFGGTNEIKNLIGKLQQKLGLSEFGFGSETRMSKPQEIDPTKFNKTAKPGEALTTNTAFVLGKYLTPKIYIGYSMGLLDPVNIFRVKYFMGRHWSVQTQTSTLGSGGDLMYTIETN